MNVIPDLRISRVVIKRNLRNVNISAFSLTHKPADYDKPCVGFSPASDVHISCAGGESENFIVFVDIHARKVQGALHHFNYICVKAVVGHKRINVVKRITVVILVVGISVINRYYLPLVVFVYRVKFDYR